MDETVQKDVVVCAPSSSSGSLTRKRTPRYCYESLPSEGKWIRVLHLIPNRGRIKVFLKTIEYTEANYKALSYVWGSPETPFKAYVLDPGTGETLGFIPLTLNLRNALCNLRDSRFVVDTVFWIDQICINQVDDMNEEKNHQVAMMSEIYKNASGVITNIGQADSGRELERRGLELIKKLDRHFCPSYDYLANHHLDKIAKDLSVLPVNQLPSDLHFADQKLYWGWKWLVEVIIFGEWTKRLWMVQEQLLNPNTVMLRGRRILQWESVAAIAVLFFVKILPEKALLSVFQGTSNAGTSLIWDHLWPLTQLWQQRQKLITSKPDMTGLTRTLLENMDAFGFQKCFNPRDRIYSLLGISRDAAALNIRPDYVAEESKAFCDASMRILSSANNLDALRYICGDTMNSEAARSSWAISTPRPFFNRSLSIESPDIRAHPQLTTNARFTSDGRALLLRGRNVDSITFVSLPNYGNRSMMNRINDEASTSFYLTLLHGWSEALLDAPALSAEAVRSFCRCLLLDPLWNPAPKDKRSQDQEYIYHILCTYLQTRFTNIPHIVEHLSDIAVEKVISLAIERLTTSYVGLGLQSTPPSDRELTSREDYDARIFHSNLRQVGRSFGKTANGKFFNAMHHPQNGDVVMAFEGSQVLWILRPVGNQEYRLLGDIYVDGYMQGELYDGVDPDEVDYEIRIV